MIGHTVLGFPLRYRYNDAVFPLTACQGRENRLSSVAIFMAHQDKQQHVRPLAETEAAWVPEYFGDEYLRLYAFRKNAPVRSGVPRRDAGRTRERRRARAGPGCGRDATPSRWRHAGFAWSAGLSARTAGCRAIAARDAGWPSRWCAGYAPVALLRGVRRGADIFTAFGYFSDADNARVLEKSRACCVPAGGSCWTSPIATPGAPGATAQLEAAGRRHAGRQRMELGSGRGATPRQWLIRDGRDVSTGIACGCIAVRS